MRSDGSRDPGGDPGVWLILAMFFFLLLMIIGTATLTWLVQQ